MFVITQLLGDFLRFVEMYYWQVALVLLSCWFLTLLLCYTKFFRQLLVTSISSFFRMSSNKYFSLIMKAFSRRVPYDLRPGFRRVVPDILKDLPLHHSHPRSATQRSTANDSIDRFINTSGFIPYSVSMSNRDVRHNNDGQRYHHFASDLDTPFNDDTIQPHHVLKFIDVDYYADMHHYCSFGNTIILYSFVPITVAGSSTDATYTIIDDYVHYHLNGGASYIHRVYDYETDHLIFNYWWGSIIYLVESFCHQEKSRRIVGLFPVAHVYGPFAWFLPGNTLKFRQFTFSGFNFNLFQKNTKDNITETFRTFSEVGDRHSAVVRDDLFRAALIRCDQAKHPAISDVERIFRSAEVENPVYASSLFLKIYVQNRSLLDLTPPITSFLDPETITYSPLGPIVTADCRPSAYIIGPRVFNDSYGYGFTPGRNYNSDVATYSGRIAKVACHLSSYPPFYHRCAEEFNNLLVPTSLVHTFCPLSISDVETYQNRPSQRSGNARARYFPFFKRHKITVTTFQKAEVYSKISDPRNISTVPADQRVRFSSFMYVVSKLFKEYKWYAFGRTPKEITEMVQDLVSKCSNVLPTDFSRMDGTRSSFFVEKEQALGRRMFAPCYHAEFVNLCNTSINAPAFTAFDLSYFTGTSRLSGNADTSCFNTYDNALVNYIALRHLYSEPFDAFNKLGIYGGDDGITGDLSEELFIKVSTKLGLKPKAQSIPRFQPVPFLGRIFIDPWTTGANICDVLRRINSLHISVSSPNLPRSLILRRKAESYSITDPNTPIISQWCKMILRITLPHTYTDAELRDTKYDTSWFDQYTDQFDPPPISCPSALMVVLDNCSIGLDEYNSIVRAFSHVQNVKQFDDLQPFFSRGDPKIEIPAVIGGNVVLPVPQQAPCPNTKPIPRTNHSGHDVSSGLRGHYRGSSHRPNHQTSTNGRQGEFARLPFVSGNGPCKSTNSLQGPFRGNAQRNFPTSPGRSSNSSSKASDALSTSSRLPMPNGQSTRRYFPIAPKHNVTPASFSPKTACKQ